MNAKIKTPQQNARNYGGDKETVNTYELVAIYKGKLVNAVSVRVYMGRSNNASTVYASIWCNNGKDLYLSGRGSAGGYGYHKESSAIGEAIRSAGIELDECIDGRGDSSVRDSMHAICRALGFRGQTIIV